MPKKLKLESQVEQSKRFKEAVRELEVAGELNPIEAEAAMDNLVRKFAARNAK